MDPNATLRLIEEHSGDPDAVDAISHDLAEWLQKGGFAPQWQDYQTGSLLFRMWQRGLFEEE